MTTEKTAKLHLQATPREQFGKKLKKVRHQGLIPSNVFGPGFTSASITVVSKDFLKTYKVARETGVVYLDLNKEAVPVLIRHIQRHPLSHEIIHVDFRKIDLKQKIEALVPLKTVNDSPAVAQGGVLLTQTDKVTVEALPEEMPQEIEIDLSVLTEVGSELRIKDLPTSTAYQIKDEAEKVLMSVIAHKEESITPETTVATPEVLTEKEGEATTEEGAAAPAEKPAEEPKKE